MRFDPGHGWSPQEGPQHDYVCCPMPEVFLGGARGGGKTDGVLGKWAIKERRYGPGFSAMFFRPSTVSSEDAIERSRQIYEPLGGKFRDRPPRWRMPNGGRVGFAYLENIKDADEYQGRNLSDAAVEEAGLYADRAPIDRLFGVLRSSAGVPIQLTLTANPGGAGQHWLRNDYQLHPFPLRPKVLRRKLPDGSEHRVAVIPSRLTNNKILLQSDPGYQSRLYLVGSAQLVKAWLEGDWTAVEGAFFSEWSNEQHVIAPFPIPEHWLRFRSGDWGSYAPFSIGWWAVVGDDFQLRGLGDGAVDAQRSEPGSRNGQSVRTLPRGALVRYREWYGAKGGKLTADAVGKGIAERERSDRAKLTYAVLDPAAFSEDGGPSIAERINNELLAAHLAAFTPADNARVTRATGDPAKAGPMGGWDTVRARMVGTAARNADGSVNWATGRPMIYFFATCTDSIRTIPVLQHDKSRAEDLDTNSEDHAADDVRYGCMSRPWIKSLPKQTPAQADGYRSTSSAERDAAYSVGVL